MPVSPPAPVYLKALTTALPEHRISQDEVQQRVASAMPGGMPARLAAVYQSAGIEERHIALPAEAYMQPMGWEERNSAYLSVGQQLMERVATDALDKARLAPRDIGTIVCVSTTGIATPAIPTQMLEPMGFAGSTRIVPLFGFGCAGGILGMEIAADLQRAAPDKPVLLLTMELCSLAFRLGERTKKAIIASTLFADGASAMVLDSTGPGPLVGGFTRMTWPGTRDMMGWDVDGTGLGLILSRDIPSFVHRELAPVIDRFLEDEGIALSALSEPACHPGGRKVVEALEAYLGQPLPHTREILTHHGNMSSPTVHFVLERILATPGDGPLLMTALGPGFTGAAGLLHR